MEISDDIFVTISFGFTLSISIVLMFSMFINYRILTNIFDAIAKCNISSIVIEEVEESDKSKKSCSCKKDKSDSETDSDDKSDSEDEEEEDSDDDDFEYDEEQEDIDIEDYDEEAEEQEKDESENKTDKVENDTVNTENDKVCDKVCKVGICKTDNCKDCSDCVNDSKCCECPCQKKIKIDETIKESDKKPLKDEKQDETSEDDNSSDEAFIKLVENIMHAFPSDDINDYIKSKKEKKDSEKTKQ